jgi:small conductance mechanosensitive channel
MNQVRDIPLIVRQNGGMTNSDSLDWFLGEPLKILIIFLTAFVIRLLITRASNRVIRQAFGTKERRDQRSSTISNVLNTITSVIVWGTAILMALTVIGVNIGPLLASAGIAGVALGFGAQTLVKDYISGLFLIIEDQYGIGDDVEIGTVKGRVEAVALRTTRVRDEAGVLWYIRNGEILNVANFSQNTSWEK